MSHLTILVDMDDTIENLLAVWVDTLNHMYARNVALDDIYSWDIKSYYPGLSVEEVFNPLNTKEFWDKVTPIPGAVETLQKIHDEGDHIMIATATHPYTVALKYDAIIKKYFPFIQYQDIIITSHKQLIRGDILIDDAPHNLVGGSYHKIMITAPHNRRFNTADNDIIRCDTWDEIYQEICKFRNKEV